MPIKKYKTKTTLTGKNLSALVYNLRGDTNGKINLPGEIFKVKINQFSLAQYIRVYLANQRSGSASTKTRAEVTGSTRKIYRQKGTGRARHGDIKAPIFIGGGIVHGPQPRDYSLDIPKKLKRKVFFGMLSEKFSSDHIKIISGLENIKSKTKEMIKILEKMGYVSQKKMEKILLVVSKKAENAFLAGRNIPYLTIKPVYTINVYDLMKNKHILFTQDAIETLINRYSEVSNSIVTRSNETKEDKHKSRPVIKLAQNKIQRKKKGGKKPKK